MRIGDDWKSIFNCSRIVKLFLAAFFYAQLSFVMVPTAIAETAGTLSESCILFEKRAQQSATPTDHSYPPQVSRSSQEKPAYRSFLIELYVVSSQSTTGPPTP